LDGELPEEAIAKPQIFNLIFRVLIDDKEIVRQSFQTNFLDKWVTNGAIKLNGLVVEKPSKIKFEILQSDGKSIGDYCFCVNQSPQPKVNVSVQPNLVAAGN
jgi:hypothetical protein